VKAISDFRFLREAANQRLTMTGPPSWFSEALIKYAGGSMKKVVALCCLILCATVWLFTGGIFVSDYWSYDGQSSITTGKGLAFTLWIDTHVQEHGIPLVFLHCRDKMPYSIRLSVYDHEEMT
jgi:hypothetical protein